MPPIRKSVESVTYKWASLHSMGAKTKLQPATTNTFTTTFGLQFTLSKRTKRVLIIAHYYISPICVPYICISFKWIVKTASRDPGNFTQHFFLHIFLLPCEEIARNGIRKNYPPSLQVNCTFANSLNNHNILVWNLTSGQVCLFSCTGWC